MPQKNIFADEAGCFTFTRNPNVSRYFILCTILMDECSVGNTLLELRRHLARSGAPLGEYFHACEDKQAIRDAVFEAIRPHKFQIHATIMEKAKAQPQVRLDMPRFYKYGWYYHFKHGVSKAIPKDCDTLVAPGVWDELKRLTPRTESGALKHKLFQRLTDDFGHPKLREHMAAILMLMKYSPDWETFMYRLDREFPQWGETMMLPFPDNYTPAAN